MTQNQRSRRQPPKEPPIFYEKIVMEPAFSADRSAPRSLPAARRGIRCIRLYAVENHLVISAVEKLTADHLVLTEHAY